MVTGARNWCQISVLDSWLESFVSLTVIRVNWPLVFLGSWGGLPPSIGRENMRQKKVARSSRLELSVKSIAFRPLD